MEQDFEKLFGPVIGKGSQATVYAKGDFAVKLYREGYPKRSVFSEAYIMANLECDNFPGPKVYEVLLVGKRYGLRMDRVNGKLMSDFMRDPESCRETINTLVDLQCRLQNEVNIADWAPDIKIRLHNDLLRNEKLPAGLKRKFLEDLRQLPDGQALCHCDFHSGNVFFDGEKYTIIDLLQISKGDPAADAACSYVSYCLIDAGVGEYYLNRYCDVSGVGRERVRAWLPVYAGTLLGQLPERFTPVVERFITGKK